MKKAFSILLSLLLVFALCVPGMAAEGGASNDGTEAAVEADLDLAARLAAGDYEWSYVSSGDYYALKGVYFVADDYVVDSTYQTVNIYVPGAYVEGIDENGCLIISETSSITGDNGVTYTAETAPMCFKCEGPGYSENAAGSANTTYLKQGYVYVSPGHRGKNTVADEIPAELNKNGNPETYDGKSPWAVIDCKACIRYLKFNDAVIPGSAERIISFASSGGGAMATFIGCEANADVFYAYLKEAGAIVRDYEGDDSFTGDLVFGSCGYCPITNVGNADIAYEWFLGTQGEEGHLINAGEFKQTLSSLMADEFVSYIETLGVTDSFEDFEEEFWEDISYAATYYIHEIMDGTVTLDWDVDVDLTSFRDVAENYIAGNYGGLNTASTASSASGEASAEAGDDASGEIKADSKTTTAASGEASTEAAASTTGKASSEAKTTSTATTSAKSSTSPNKSAYTAADGGPGGSGGDVYTSSVLTYADCLAVSEDGESVIVAVPEFYESKYSRQKDVTSFDGLDNDLTENKPLGNQDQDCRHFSLSLFNTLIKYADTLAPIYDANPVAEAESYEELLAAYAQDIFGMDALDEAESILDYVAAFTAADDTDCVYYDEYGNCVIDLYNPMCFLGYNDAAVGEQDYTAGSEVAAHMRLRMGTSDANTALPIITLLRLGLENYGAEVDMEFVWQGGHTEIEQSDTTICDWIDAICSTGTD